MRIIELFAGIGACSKALDKLGIEHEIVDAVEIDKYAIKSFNAIHNTDFEVQDITKWDKDFKDIDLIMHGSPCQDFSVAGNQAGGDLGSGTRSSLMYETIRIVGKIRPKYIIWENVKNLLSAKHKHNFDKYIDTLNTLGYNSYYQVLNAKDYGIAQNRERIFTISIRQDIDKKDFVFPEPIPLKLRLRDFLDNYVDEKYYLKKAFNIKRCENYIQWSNSGKMQNNQGERAYYIDNDIIGTIPNKNSGDKTQVVFAEKEVIRKYGVFDTEKSKHQAGSVYDENGLAPTLDTMQGGWRQPCIEVDKNIKPSVAVNFEREKEQIAQTDKEIYQCKCDSGWQDNKVGIKVSPTIRAENNNTFGLTKQMRIRKLTPRECWRLMGFSDLDFEKAERTKNSNTQLYKQAGNSIVVNVLEEIFKKLFKGGRKEK